MAKSWHIVLSPTPYEFVSYLPTQILSQTFHFHEMVITLTALLPNFCNFINLCIMKHPTRVLPHPQHPPIRCYGCGERCNVDCKVPPPSITPTTLMILIAIFSILWPWNSVRIQCRLYCFFMKSACHAYIQKWQAVRLQ